MNQREQREAADLLERVRDAVDRGHLLADGPLGIAIARRLEGALLALEAMNKRPSE